MLRVNASSTQHRNLERTGDWRYSPGIFTCSPAFLAGAKCQRFTLHIRAAEHAGTRRLCSVRDIPAVRDAQAGHGAQLKAVLVTGPRIVRKTRSGLRPVLRLQSAEVPPRDDRRHSFRPVKGEELLTHRLRQPIELHPFGPLAIPNPKTSHPSIRQPNSSERRLTTAKKLPRIGAVTSANPRHSYYQISSRSNSLSKS